MRFLHKLFGCRYRGGPKIHWVTNSYAPSGFYLLSHACYVCGKEYRTWNTAREIDSAKEMGEP